MAQTSRPIRAFRRIVTDPLIDACLDAAQQLRLQPQIHFGDFVEEQGTTIGPRRRALPVRCRSRERAFHMPENLAFHKLFRDRRAIDDNKRLVGARPFRMNRGGANFLARAAFAGDENGSVGRRSACDDTIDSLHHQGRTDESTAAGL